MWGGLSPEKDRFLLLAFLLVCDNNFDILHLKTSVTNIHPFSLIGYVASDRNAVSYECVYR